MVGPGSPHPEPPRPSFRLPPRPAPPYDTEEAGRTSKFTDGPVVAELSLDKTILRETLVRRW